MLPRDLVYNPFWFGRGAVPQHLLAFQGAVTRHLLAFQLKMTITSCGMSSYFIIVPTWGKALLACKK